MYVVKTIALAQAVVKAGGNYIIVQPEPKDGEASMFALPTYKQLEGQGLGQTIVAHLCQFNETAQVHYGITVRLQVGYSVRQRPGVLEEGGQPGPLPAGTATDITRLSEVTQNTQLAAPAARTSKQIRLAEEQQTIGGMRGPFQSINKLPLAPQAGLLVRVQLEATLATYPELARDLLAAIGNDPPQVAEEIVEDTHRRVLNALGRAPAQKPKSGISPELLDAFSERAGDPDRDLARWLREGAPLGITLPITRRGIFPAVDEEGGDPPDLQDAIGHDGWDNYVSFEQEPEAAKELLASMEQKGWAKTFTTRKDLEEYLKDTDIPACKMGLVKKQKADGTYKYRIVWDLRRSGSNAKIRQGERVLLPRLNEPVSDALHFAADRSSEEGIEFAVIDIKDAFHLIWLAWEEQKYQATFAFGVWYIYLVLIFGSRSAPTIWGRYAAWLGRFLTAVSNRQRVRTHIYVDDPLFILKGTRKQRDHDLAIVLLAAMTAGYPLAWKKGARGTGVTWIGASISTTDTHVCVTIPESKIAELKEMLRTYVGRPMLPRASLRSFVGKCGFVAGLVIYLRPFLAPLWAACTGVCSGAATTKDRRKADTFVNAKRVAFALAWIRAFLERAPTLLTRSFPVDGAAAVKVHFAIDASPWGIGGVLFNDEGFPVEYFDSQLTAVDEEQLHATIGESGFTTLWEALCLLVALRLWAVTGERVVVSARSDSLSTLYACTKLAATSIPVNKVVCEISLDLAEMLYEIEYTEHIPGVSNTLADALSRRHAPVPKPHPPELVNAHRREAPARGTGFWRTLAYTKSGLAA